MDTLSVLCISPDGRYFGNTIKVGEVTPEIKTKLIQSIDHCTEKIWPKCFIKSQGPIQITWSIDE